MMNEIGKSLLIFGVLLVIVGLALVFGGKIPFLGRLPGDIAIKRESFGFYFPITTCLVVSLILSLIFRLFR